MKLSQFPKNPCYQCAMQPRHAETYSRKFHIALPFGIRYSKFLSEIETPLEMLVSPEVCNTAPWQISDPVVDIALASVKKGSISHGEFLATALQHLENFSESVLIYTDGSKSDP